MSRGHTAGMRMPALILFAAQAVTSSVYADPLHVRPDDSYWHHDSHWIFPARVGDFVRVGIPQDIAGSREATAWYAIVVDGVRVVASVEIQEASTPQDPQRAPLAQREAGDWVVRLYVQAPSGTTLPQAVLDAFVNGQRWDTLPTP
jgi:hypothetical protein